MKLNNQDIAHARRTLKTIAYAVASVALFASGAALATNGGTSYGGTDQKICGFFDDINGLLSMASIAVVTIAVIFSGYQIAFAHKRIGDVAPILIGGVLIGAAGQISTMLIGQEGEQCSTTMVMHLSQYMNA
ncbi:TrbC/VirB2 family protein [Xanthomonas campestris pv. raphani]|uniref:TrbC/VirB2 family protein n=1 Tax=Xanthomonas campestris TaxID=339 RepID=UPI000E328F00|nr:TrbC/VirB2 family protein [Xanthomonas campestris]MEA9489322.1 TrbC/VirB2 family protein [Xanthomonas campestris]MEA9509824.1 TrbC/VirB2 family protein [Xanthomonas campestris]MEA9576910.1 TrbC/VirB2 family protein [Xanthomonas campestris]MEA9656515.1 TrbC/VirB2 family protein [Xanthomonas campestris pv. raphani]MEA9659838.1 TrbC/VirB2 family protein [Xanthomonas campestris pv. raphani]